MLLSLLGELLILSVAFDQALAAPSQTDLGYRQQGGPELHNGHVFRRDDAADLRHSRSFSLPTTAATSASYITLVTPSPGASAISVTFQGQIITSYSALTVCPTTTSSSTPTALSSSSSAVSVGISSAPTISPSAITYGFPRRQVSGPYANIKTIPAPYANTTHTSVPSVPDSLVTSCSITYMPTTTAICHTTITPLGGIPVPVSACDQNITFSTDHEIASTAGSKELLTVFYVAPWPDVVTGVPTGTVQKEICNSASQCSTVQEKWSISTAMITQTQTNTLSVNTVVTGVSTASSSAPALVILPPSSTLTLTDSTPSTISTSLVYEIFSTKTSLEIFKQTLSGSTTPTQTGAVVPSTTITRTSTSTMTVTLQGMTQTLTISSVKGLER